MITLKFGQTKLGGELFGFIEMPIIEGFTPLRFSVTNSSGAASSGDIERVRKVKDRVRYYYRINEVEDLKSI